MVHKSTLFQQGGSGGGVSSLNALTGAVDITSTGGTVVITEVGNNINLEASGGSSGTVVAVTTFSYAVTPSSGLTVFNVYVTGAAVLFDLPITPAVNEIIRIVDAGNVSGTKPITINGSGNNIVAYGSATNSSIQINANGGDIWLAWDGSNWA